MADIQPIHWLSFVVAVAILVSFDLVFARRNSHELTWKQSLLWTAAWCLVSTAFGVFVWYWLGQRAAIEYATGYLIEWSLSVDNLVVFAAIFETHRIRAQDQQRILLCGIVGAMAMRLVFVLLGARLIERAEWLMPLFGAFLIYSACALAWPHRKDRPSREPWLHRLARAVLPVASTDRAGRFFRITGGRWCVTPLFLVLVLVEITDILFAIDSIPAVFGVVNHRSPHFQFIVFTSNVAAILGLRALYFVIAGALAQVRHLRYGLSAVLLFVGADMAADYALPRLGLVQIEEGERLLPPWMTLLVVVGALGATAVGSLTTGRGLARSRIERRPRPG